MSNLIPRKSTTFIKVLTNLSDRIIAVLKSKKSLWRLFSALGFISLLFIINACQSLPAVHPDLLKEVKQSHVVIDNVNVLTMTNEKTPILYHQQLEIKNGLIFAMLPAGSSYDKTAQYIDAKQAFISPGLIDMHVHVMDRQALMLSLSYGVTTVRILRGMSQHLLWKKELENQQWLGSNLVVSTPVFDHKDTHLLNLAADGSDHVEQLVLSFKEQGYDLIKVYGSLPHTEYKALYQQANALNFPIAKHGPNPSEGGNWASLSGLQSLEHVEEIFQGPLNYQFDYQKLVTVVEKLKTLNVSVTPTLAVFDHLAQLSHEKEAFIETIDLAFINPVQKAIETKYSVARWLADKPEQSAYHFEKFEFLKDIVTELHRQGVPLIVGSDAGVMYSLQGEATHLEMALLHESGLSTYQALLAATVNPAKALKRFDRFGSIEVGKVADLLLSETNPLTNLGTLKQPLAVIKSGQYLSKTQLEHLKEDAKKHPNYWFTFFELLNDKIGELIM